ncbi:MAG TPA: fumarate hydratase C-terminal domain-containing protein [Vicinamibacterales bacterium]|jgi:fumarate hydratase subunit beta|nr:fumarate hydratase C-terminal domain-containing protein [Vicinamibacterales bacterium]
MTDVVRLEWRHGAPDLSGVRAGDAVELTGRVLTLRDASAARLARAIEAGDALPLPLAGQILYAVGPSPAKPGQIIGSAGPTTTARMSRYFPSLFASGVRAVIGKGELHGDDMATFTANGVVYFAAIGGLGALLARHITAATIVAYEELGPEALYALDVAGFPAVTIIDTTGRNFHEEARRKWALTDPESRPQRP